jgi:GT2 family glycosyltransferase
MVVLHAFDMAKVSIVILNYNGKSFLKQFLPQVVANSQEAEVIVADNGSTDDSIPFLREHFPNIRRIALDQNHGFSGGYNLALEQIDSEYYVLLNSDVEVTPNWIDPIITYMDTHPHVGACQPKIRSFTQKSHFEYAGAAGGYLDVLGYPFCRGRLFQTIEEDLGQYDDRKEIFWATGACLFVRSSTFHEVNGFDYDYFAHMEEIDFCWRIKKAGHQLFYIPESIVYHVGGGTLPKESPRKTYLNFRNSLATLYKNESSTKLLWKIPARLLLDLVAAGKFLLTDGLESYIAVIRANIDFYRMLPDLKKKRKTSNSLKKKVRLPYRGLLVWDYYIKGKKTYSEL